MRECITGYVCSGTLGKAYNYVYSNDGPQTLRGLQELLYRLGTTDPAKLITPGGWMPRAQIENLLAQYQALFKWKTWEEGVEKEEWEKSYAELGDFLADPTTHGGRSNTIRFPLEAQ